MAEQSADVFIARPAAGSSAVRSTFVSSAQAGTPAGKRLGVSPRWWHELLLAAAFYGIYDLIRGLISGSTARAESDGRDLLHWEKLAHLNPEHLLNNGLQHVPWLAVPACYFYATLHFVLTPGVLVWTYHRHRERYRQARSVLAVITGAALIGFWSFPTAPPRLLSGGHFHDTLAVFSGWGWWGTDASVPTGAATLANQYAAMPSLHLAWALWCGVVIASNAQRRLIKIAGAAYPVITAMVVLGTANHYLLDVLAGVGLWIISAVAVNLWMSVREGAAVRG